MGTGLKRPFAKRSAALHVWLEKCLYDTYDTYDTSFMDHCACIDDDHSYSRTFGRNMTQPEGQTRDRHG